MKRPALERFMEKVEKQDGPDGCWLWAAAKERGGYGSFKYEGKQVRAHRWAYEHFVGPIPEGLQLDHLCRVRHCVRPGHLEPVTNRENAIRGDGPKVAGLRNKGKTHCPQGHPYDDENTYRSPTGARFCRACRREERRRRALKRHMDDRRRGYSLPPYWQKITG